MRLTPFVYLPAELAEPQSRSAAAEIKSSEQICEPVCQSVLGTGLDMTAVGERSVLSKILATLAAVALAIVLGAVDYLTGREWAISALYLLPTCLAGWVAGRLAGFALGALCTGVWFLSDMLNGAAYHHPLIPAWNAVMLFVFFFVVVYLLTAFHRSHYHLEQTVERRTAALRAEMDERKRLEHAKLQAERLAVVGSMAAQVAHEIRNPLGAISLNLDLIGEEVNAHPSGECHILLREMRLQVLRIHQVLQEYLRFGRMPKSERAVLSLNAWLEEKLNFVQPLLGQKHVDLRRKLDPDLPPVHADADQLWEALSNLIRNAVDAMPAGGNLTVSAKRSGAEALVSISDNGRGMTEEEARNLFVPFFTTKGDGTGLGLAYTQQVISEHGGRIDYATVRGKGSTFSIQLPLAVGA
jgi:signal transduction histidine kinase